MSRQGAFQDNNSAVKKQRRSLQANIEAYQFKRDLLAMYEKLGVEDGDYLRDLRRRVRQKQVQLENRGYLTPDS